MDNKKWTEEVNNKELADGLEGCEIIDDTMLEIKDNKSEKDGEINIEYVDESAPNQDIEYIDQTTIDEPKQYIDESIINQNEQDEIIANQNSIDEMVVTEDVVQEDNQDEDDDGLLFLSKDKEENEEEPQIQNLNVENKVDVQEFIDEESARKKEELNIQNEWGRDLGEFPVEKKKEEDEKQSQEDETTKTETEEEIEPIKMPILSPETVADSESTKIKIVKPKDFNELVSKNGDILENYISGDAKFKSISENLYTCIELCKLFARVHSTGCCFNGLTASDIVITQNKECKLVNDEKIVSPDDEEYEINYEKTCAPEVIKNESRPNINSDKYTMAFLLFGILFKSNPFEGSKMLNTVCYTKEDELKFYEEPVFVYSHKDKSNMPVYGIHSVLIKYWNRFYSDDIKMIFKESFVEGINDPEARVEDKTFIEKLIGFKNVVDSRNAKKEPKINVKLESKPESSLEKTKQKIKEGISFVKNTKKQEETKDFEEKQNIIEINKDAVKKTVEQPKTNYVLRIDYSYTEDSSIDYTLVDLSPGVEIKNNTVGYDDIPNENIIGRVIQNAKHKGVIGLKNLSNHKWLATKGDRELKEFPPGKVIVITEGVKIDFYPENKSKSKSKWSIVKA